MSPRFRTLFLIIFGMILAPRLGLAQEGWQQQVLAKVQNGAVLAVDEKGKVLFSHQADKPFMPASTLKVATSLAALNILGENYRYKTDFFTDGSGNLYVKGYGDPFLISEELALIAAQLKAKGLKGVKNMILDGSYFGPDVQVPGLAGSLNPYDAYNGALLANFNTINIVKSGGEIRSGEDQTPMTEITRVLAANAPAGKSRINVATHEKEAALYPGYLLKEFLAQQGVEVGGSISQGTVPGDAKLFLSYASSKNLREVLEAALKYSQNLVMNQLALTMGAVKYGAPASLGKAKKALDEFLTKEVGLKDFNIEEGSGISRQNHITALEFSIQVPRLGAFRGFAQPSLQPTRGHRLPALREPAVALIF
ncbi:MAG: D-alanyl-D-alanine carboxypeptidase [Deltaproteobacteria bacterium]|nr:D-alanyl-D-alanine carboxypeptidase [Deltaproteobacteria bacterium]